MTRLAKFVLIVSTIEWIGVFFLSKFLATPPGTEFVARLAVAIQKMWCGP